MNRQLLPVVPLVLLALSIGCKKDPAPGPDGGTARVDLALATFEPPSIDPCGLKDSVGARVAINLFEGLVTRAADGTPVPGAAASWTMSDDGLQWRFTLRDGLQWSDGAALTAADFEYSFRRALTPKTENAQGAMLYPIKGAEPFHKGDATDWAAVGVEAPDNRTLVITLERPYASTLRLLASAYALPSPRHAVEAHGLKWTRPEHIVSNGAYVLKSHDHGERMVLAKNPRFHAAGDVALEDVTFRFTKDEKVAWDWYTLGEIDWSVGLIPDVEMKRMLEERSEALRIDDFAGVFLLYVNASKPPFDDVRVRRAIDLALDRGRLVRQVLGSGQRPASSIIPPQMTKALAPKRARYDVATAKALLADVGPLPPVELIFNANEKMRRIAEFVARDLKTSLGLQIDVRSLDWKTFLQQLGSPEYSMGALAMGGFDAVDFMQLVRGDSPDNRSRWKSAQYDALIGRARQATTPEGVDTVLTEALALLDREVPIVPVFRMTRNLVVRPGLKGLETNYDSIHPLRWMRWEATP